MLRTGEYPSVYKWELEQLLEKADPNIQGRQSIPKSGGRTPNYEVLEVCYPKLFLNSGTLKRNFQRFGGTYKVRLQC